MTGVIFDFNGTMFFDEWFQEQSWKQFIRQKGKDTISEEDFQKYIHGVNADISLAYILGRDLTRDEVLALEEEKEVLYRELCLKSTDFKLAEGLTDFLDSLKEKQIPMTIATASGYNNVRFFFKELHLDRWFHFDKVVYNDGSFKGKPNPDIFLKASQKLHIPITDCIVFEDSRSGIEAAKRAKAKKVIGVASMLDEQTLNTLGVTASIKDYQDFKTLSQLITD